MRTVILTLRQPEFAEHVFRLDLVRAEDCEVIDGKPTPDDLLGAHVISFNSLGIGLAAFAEKVTIININFTPDVRGRELSLEEIESHAGSPRTYQVKVVH